MKQLLRSASASQLTHQSTGRGGRETMEVLDTASNPSTARSNMNEDELDGGDRGSSLGSAPSSSAGSLGHDNAASEVAARNLDFASEQQRVQEEMDTFVPRAGMRLEQLDAERVRLERLQRRAVEAHLDREELAAGVDFRQAWLEGDKAAAKVQALFRGGLGRRRVALLHERAALEAKIREDWVEVRDEETADIWYFNQSSGESQWDMPESLMALIPSG